MKGLIEKRNALLDEMELILDKAKAETRVFTPAEEKRIEKLKADVKGLEKVIRAEDDKRVIENPNLNKQEEKERETMGNNREERALKNVILPNEKFKIETRGLEEGKKVNFANLVKGMAGLGWGTDEETRTYYRSMQSGTNKTVIPSVLAGQIIDFARNKSAILGNIPLAPMEHNNMTVAVQNKDAEAHWVQEGELITASDVTFKGVTLEGKTLAIFLPITEQLLESAENLESQLISSCSQALSVALDKAILYGTGAAGQIKGITEYAGINTIQYDPADVTQKNYDLIIKGTREIKKANLNPTNTALNVGLASDLVMTKTGDGFYIEAPKYISQYEQSESNNLKENEGIVYDKDQLLLGIHKNMTIEWGTSADQFQRIIKGLRIVMRCDLAVLNEKAITHIKPQ